MSTKSAFLGVDIGTGSCRVLAIDCKGTILTLEKVKYPTIYPYPGWAEQDPEKIYGAMIKAVRSVTQKLTEQRFTVEGVGLSSVYHSLIALGNRNQLLTRSIIWEDLRSASVATDIKKTEEAKDFYHRTGCPVHPLYPLAKIAWLRKNRPETFNQATKFISIKEYILLKLFGSLKVDYSVASASGLFNIHQLNWDDAILDFLQIKKSQLSETVSTLTVLKPMLPEPAQAMGLSPEVPWVIGSGDGALANLGSGVTSPGAAVVTVGTSGAVRVTSYEPKLDSQERTWCYHVTDGRWIVGGAINNGGLVYQWLADTFFEDEKGKLEQGQSIYHVLNTLAAEVPPGAQGLIFLPFLNAERSPYWNSQARGVLLGLGLEHRKKHLVRAALEGIVFRLYSVFEILEEIVGSNEEIRVCGGFVKSPIWLQILSSVFNRKINVPNTVESSALGSALLGMVGMGVLSNIEDVRKIIQVRNVCEPDDELHLYYQKLYQVYKRIYWKMVEEFQALAELRQ
ncbi:gluconokinase [Calderihabitans maritimus]|uniref:Gluconokinase n=1 Tax=Calderihabitans maritimus TaxID=1246530 RepID=A0A1Z5HQZ1_9FIRM|nr:gluconokinase [Calderihabitans maritimus]GAW91946.1 gluconokinase [Calderihabitans maritimus]